VSAVVVQVEAYLACSDSLQQEDLLSFWSSRSSQWPHLSSVARDLLGVPASSTASERSFSVTGCTVNERRTQLRGDSVDGLLFIHGLQ